MAYIPEKHKGLGLLPRSTEASSEVFSYPSSLIEEIEEMLFELEGIAEDIEYGRPSLLIPYGRASYNAYQAEIEAYFEKYSEHEVAELLKLLSLEIRRMNVKEDWSVVRYVGHQFDGDDFASLTPGRCYYWPCSRENPVYTGVIDDEEFTTYLYPCDSESWEIVDDPTGMAARTLAGEAETVSEWRIEEDSSEWVDFIEKVGARPKRAGSAEIPLEFLGFDWSASDKDIVPITCPGCGSQCDFEAMTLLNVLDAPDMARSLKEGILFDFVCSRCGFSAGVPHPCLYLDPIHGACVYLVVNEEMRSGVEQMFTELARKPSARGVRFRIVDDRRALRDKAVAFDACIDDRALEMLKSGVRGQARMQGIVSEGASCGVFLEEVAGDTLELALYVGDDRFSVGMDRGACELFEADIANSSLASKQPFYVDEEWVRHAMEVMP